MVTADPPRRPVETVRVAFEILEYLRERGGATITDIAADLGTAKSTVHRHVRTLQHLEYVVETDGAFYPSLLFLDYGIRARNRQPGYGMAREKVDELADETSERVQFVVEEHGQTVYIYKAMGEHAVRTDPSIGRRGYLHTTASGKAILANLPDGAVDRIVDHRGLPELTDRTITGREELAEELALIRDRGYATNKQESLAGLRAVGVPVLAPDGDVIGAISVSGPTRRMTGEWFEETLPSLLLGTANELELNVAHAMDATAAEPAGP